MANTQKTPTQDLWLILGASSPICQEFARLVAAQGCEVILAGRQSEILEVLAADLRLRSPSAAIATLPFDASLAVDRHKLAEFCRQAVENRPVSLHVMLGFAHQEPQERIEQEPDLAAKVINISLAAAAASLMGLLPYLTDASRPSRVVIIASVSGDRGRRSNYVYGAAKAGLIALASGLRSRLYPSGGHVVTAKLGFIDTATTWGGEKIFLAAAPKETAKALLHASDRRKNVIYYPKFWGVIMAIIRVIPEGVFKRLPF
ncbi:MAG: SDR family NAD(P)-dependent oxidoreductase [Candidatus Symbiobacter sp.]|nr:SDR family NAD(P)-dependent oxidoreductase [Candidatus Symbiobacter sp.]